MKFQTISEPVEAEQFFKDKKPHPRGVEYIEPFRDQDGSLYGDTYRMDGGLISNGDWVVTKGCRRFVVKQNDFEKQYQPVPSEAAQRLR